MVVPVLLNACLPRICGVMVVVGGGTRGRLMETLRLCQWMGSTGRNYGDEVLLVICGRVRSIAVLAE